jgi:hypothetical protein
MVAVPEMPVSVPVAAFATGPSAVPARRRVVAVSVSQMELLRPESDLARLVEEFPHVDLLIAGDDGVVPHAVPAPGRADDQGDDQAEEYEAAADQAAEELHAAVATLGVTNLSVHRLGLRPPLVATDESDLVAALSELVGFDPEPGVYCLAPAQAPSDASRAVVNRAAHRIAQVYGIPLLRYRCLELCVVGQDAGG